MKNDQTVMCVVSIFVGLKARSSAGEGRGSKQSFSQDTLVRIRSQRP